MIKTKNLTKYYGKTRGIEDLSISIKQGEIFGLLGPNGAGKTTTIRMLTGMIRPTKGSASINGLDCWTQTVDVKKISGYIPGDIHLYRKETGKKLINMYGSIRNNKKLSKELIERFDFDPTRKIGSLSRGNKQKLSIILAFMFKPKVIILDEPTSGLDPLMQQEFYALAKDFQKKGATMFYSSHFLPEVEKISGKVGIVKDGHLKTIEDVKDLESKRLSVLSVTFSKKPDLKKYKIPQISEMKNVFNNTYQIKTKGDIDPVIKALSKDSVKDLSFEHRDLEEIFLEYYS